MRKKRLLSLALVAALSVTMLAGCGGKKSTESETNKDGSDKVKITLGIWPGEDLAENIPHNLKDTRRQCRSYIQT